MKTKVLIVDDSVVIRKLLSDMIAAQEDLEVAGIANNGKIALAKLSQVNPDVVVLDWEMPEMNGLETLEAIRKVAPRLPVIIFSTLSARGAQVTLDALSRGASDYVTKPSGMRGLEEAMGQISEQMLRKIRTLSPYRSKTVASATTSPVRVAPRTIGLNSRIDVVAIGCSTGGPNALSAIVPAFPKSFPVPIVVVQHMPPVFTKLLSERLNTQSELTIQEGRADAVLNPGHMWIAPGDFHMVVKREGTNVVLKTNQDSPENSCRPAVDVLFRSVAQVYGANVLAVILTGMGQDGLRGCEHIREKGGAIFVQDEASSVVWGMPGFVANAGLAEKVISIENVGKEIVARVESSGLRKIG